MHFRFQYFYPKTGVTGPYVFGGGLMTYLMSKEIYVMEHEYYSGLSILIMVIFATKKFGPSMAAYLDKEVDVSISSDSDKVQVPIAFPILESRKRMERNP